ncbi:MAG: hypothetical protein LH630_04995 [Actinomycetia bacterium]|nr:hypothetical protein [Actinomycetes bacterium]
MNCNRCTAATSNGLALCATCQQTLRVSLVNVASFHTDVLRIQPGQRVRVRSAYQSTPPPETQVKIDPITRATGHVDAIVIGWVRNLQDDRPGISQPPNDVAKACGWLEGHVTTISTLKWAGDCVREMVECELTLQRIIDRSDTGWYAGVCGNELGREIREHEDDDVRTITCPRNLYGTQGSSWVRCPECGRTWPTEERRALMIAEARDQVAPVRVVARAVVGLMDGQTSVERLTRRIEQWIARGVLRDLGTRVLDGKPRKVYNLGEVFDLVTGDVKPKNAAA